MSSGLIKKVILSIAAVLALVLSIGWRASAWTAHNEHELVGTWLVTVQLNNCSGTALGSPFASLLTFADGETFIETPRIHPLLSVNVALDTVFGSSRVTTRTQPRVWLLSISLPRRLRLLASQQEHKISRKPLTSTMAPTNGPLMPRLHLPTLPAPSIAKPAPLPARSASNNPCIIGALIMGGTIANADDIQQDKN